MRGAAKADILRRKIDRENWTHAEVAEILNCSRSTVSKAVAGCDVGEWFWKEAAGKLNCYELSRYLFDEKFSELISLKEMLLNKNKSTRLQPDAS